MCLHKFTQVVRKKYYPALTISLIILLCLLIIILTILQTKSYFIIYLIPIFDFKISKKRSENMKNNYLLFVFVLWFAPFIGCAQMGADSKFNNAASLFKDGKYNQAFESIDAAHKEYPDNNKYKGMLAWVYFKQGKLDIAEKLFQEILDEKSDSIAGMQGMAWVSFAQNDYENAVIWFNKELNWANEHIKKSTFKYYKPKSRVYIRSVASDSYYGSGTVQAAAGNYALAEKNFEKALDYPNSFTDLIEIRKHYAEALFLQQKYLLASEEFKTILAKKTDLKIVRNLITCMEMLNNELNTKDFFEDTIDDGNTSPLLLYGKVIASYLDNDHADCKKALNRLRKYSPSYACSYFVKVNILSKKYYKELNRQFHEYFFAHGDFVTARPLIKSYLLANGGNCDALMKDAWCDLYLIDVSSALNKFEDMAEHGCSQEQAFVGKGVSLLYLNKLDEASQVFEETVKKYPNNLRAHVARGVVAFKKKEYKKATKLYSHYLKYFPKHDLYFSWASHALNNLGWSYFYINDMENALKTFKRLAAFHKDPIYPQGNRGMGLTYYHLGEKKLAKKAFIKVLNIYPQDTVALYGLNKINQDKQTD